MRVPLAWSGDVTRLARAFADSAAVSAANASGWCWLDGTGGVGSGDGVAGSWSYLGIASEIVTAEPGRSGQFLARLRSRTSRGRLGADSPADEGGFSGGWVVALGYEFGVGLMGLDPADDAAAPAFALRVETVLAVDHARGLAELRGPDSAAIEAWLAEFGPLLNAPADPHASTAAERRGPRRQRRAGDRSRRGAGAHWRRSAGQYRSEVAACRAAISEGEAYVLCLTDTAAVGGVSVDPLALYLRLREGAPALRGGVIVAGGRALVSASPERFLSLRGETLSTHPIKGTRPRGATPAADAALADELRSDPKECAENLMIVDLMRNDLSRVCTPGTVAVADFLRVETHPHVHQLVSTVEGRMLPERDVFDAIEACLPGGSMTGAPKRRAVEVLAALERGPRGLYSGCFGWIDHAGDAELAMTIRSIELRRIGVGDSVGDGGDAEAGARALVGAGGGITIDSDPAREHEEKVLKAAPLLAALAD